MSEDKFWNIRVPKLRTIVEWVKEQLSENHNVKRSRKVVKEIAETFKSRTKLAVTTAVAYAIWIAFYHVIKEAINMFLPSYTGLLQSVIELAIILTLGVITLYTLSKWK